VRLLKIVQVGRFVDGSRARSADAHEGQSGEKIRFYFYSGDLFDKLFGRVNFKYIWGKFINMFKNKKRILSKQYLPYLLLLPALVFLITILIYPTLYVVDISFFKWDLLTGTPKTFIGLGNYQAMIQSSRFFGAFGRSLYFTVLSVGISFLIGFGLANLLHKGVRGKSLFTTILIVPMVVAPIIIGLAFKFMYNPDFGVINYFLNIFGIPSQPFLGDPNLALNAVILTDIWQWTPFMILVLLAGLESLPSEPFEAAKIDGASRWLVFRRITLPLMRPVILIAILIRSMDAFREFDKIFIMTGGGPGLSSETLSLLVWRSSFSWFHMGFAAAMGLFMLFVIMVISWVLIKFMGGRER